jgi:hypothetical protein
MYEHRGLNSFKPSLSPEGSDSSRVRRTYMTALSLRRFPMSINRLRRKAGRHRIVHIRLALVGLVACGAAAFAPAATASELLGRNESGVKLAVSNDGKALITFGSQGKLNRILAWGAMNAIGPTRSRAQVKFKLDYSGGYGTFRRPIWKTFGNACRGYDGPKLQWLVSACRAADGSYWALQSWQRMLPNYGLNPSPKQAVWELRLSHWKGPLPVLEVNSNWTYGRFDQIFGRFTYLGKPVYGFRATSVGVPLDAFGRNLYLDTFNSAYGTGWKRENSFLMQKPTGAFCYGFFPHGSRPIGRGERYRAMIIGPGVTPDIFWEAAAPGEYNPALDSVANAAIRKIGPNPCHA